MTVAASDIIEGACRRLGTLGEEQAVPAYMIARGVEVFNDILGEWGRSNIHIPYQSTLNIPLVENQELYTVGPSGAYDVNSAQIIEIEQCVITDSTAPNYFYPVMIGDEKQYWRVYNRASEGVPIFVLLRNYQTYSEVRFLYLPYTTTLSADLLVKQRLAQITGPTQQMTILGDEYLLPLKYQIAVDLADIYKIQLPDRFIDRAKSTVENLLAANFNIDVSVKKDEMLSRSSYGYWPWWV